MRYLVVLLHNRGAVDTHAELDLTVEHLDVYDTREGPWTPDHGAIDVPAGWDLLPSGDAFITRTVKAAGVYWYAWKPRSRSRPHRRLIGLWAPRIVIEEAQARAVATAERRERGREQGARTRLRAEERSRAELAEAIRAFLDFAPRHGALAETIAREASERAAEVGSGRVGRTRLLTLEERAALAARAHIRHRHTDYEKAIDGLVPDGGWDDDRYRSARARAAEAVEDFLRRHRR